MSSEQNRGATYREAGVDIEAADRLVSRFAAHAKSTLRPGVLGGLGGFGALFSLKDAFREPMEDPVLVSGTDGVGTKLKVAFATGRHGSIGIDLVAMCVNDILTVGAQPLFFLDYFGTGALAPEVGEAVVAGIAEGCRQARCALVGGETAELPGMYTDGEYDLAGFVVGIVERAKMITGEKVQPGHAVVGVQSRGLHSNGYSLARDVLLNRGGLQLEDIADPKTNATWADVLLEPTAIYTRMVSELTQTVPPLAMAHITGGGLPGNLNRVLPEGLTAELNRGSWTIPMVFEKIQTLGKVEVSEMDRTFNMGIGMAIVTDNPELTLETIQKSGHTGCVIGQIRAHHPSDPGTVVYQ